jgi:aldose 1-epimerase
MPQLVFHSPPLTQFYCSEDNRRLLITLTESSTGSSANISPVGAALLSLKLSGNQVIEKLATDRPELYAGVVMAPWSGRVSAGTWVHPDGRNFQLPINEAERNNALHGLAFDKEFVVARSTESSVELSIEIPQSEGYPFHLKLAIAYELDGGELICSFAVKNLSHEKAPFGLGFHPYFSTKWLGDEVSITNSAKTVYELDQSLIDTGTQKTAGSTKDLSIGKLAVGASLDDDFTDLDFVAGVSRTTLSNSAGSGIEIWQEDVFRHNVIYTTDSYEAEGGTTTAVAIEPCISAVNALNTHGDLVWLSPNQTQSGSWGIRLVN